MGGSATSMQSRIADEAPQPSSNLERKMLREDINKMLDDKLNPRESYVLRLRYASTMAARARSRRLGEGCPSRVNVYDRLNHVRYKRCVPQAAQTNCRITCRPRASHPCNQNIHVDVDLS